MSKKHPLRIRVDHNEFHFDVEIASVTTMQQQIGPLVEYAIAQAMPQFVNLSAGAQQTVQDAVTSLGASQAEVRAEERLVERIADRVIQKLADLDEGELERLSCRTAAAAGAKMKGSP